MANVKYWCSNPATTGRPTRSGRCPVMEQCRKEECAKWDSDLTCPALSLSVTVNGRTEVCYSGGE